MEELYDVRSKVVHKGQHAVRKWGWNIFEHLVMGAFVLPLVAKLLLERDGHYTRTTDDEARYLAVDKLLAVVGWVDDYDRDDDDEGDASLTSSKLSWQKIVSETKWHLQSDEIFKKMYREIADAKVAQARKEEGRF